MKNLKVYVVGPQSGYARFLAENPFLTDDMEEADLVLFTGGEDVYPPLYKERVGHRTGFGRIVEELGMPHRDHEELTAFKQAVELNKPMFGVCRGLQFLTVMNGGRLVQHVTNHAGHDHVLSWADGDETMTTSLHHQMCDPFALPKENYAVLAVAKVPLSRMYLNGDDVNTDMPVEPEVIHYPKTRSMGVQGHPEMMKFNSPLCKKLRHLIKTELLETNGTNREPEREHVAEAKVSSTDK